MLAGVIDGQTKTSKSRNNISYKIAHTYHALQKASVTAR